MPDVVVLGGGIIGLTSAWMLARTGRAVTVVDPEPGTGASQVAAGMLAPVSELHGSERALLDLSLHAAATFADHAAAVAEASGISTGYLASGSLQLALDAGDRARLADSRRRQVALGLQVEALSGQDCRELEPWLDPAVVAGTLVRGDHQVDPRRLYRGVSLAAQRSGVTVLPQRGEVIIRAGRAAGVRTADGELVAPTVVVAAGAWSVDHARVRPVKGQILRLRGPRVIHHVLRGTVRDRSVYLVPRADGEVVLGATTEDRGYDTTITVGGVHDLLSDACALVPGLAEFELVEASARPRPGSPDNLPLIGWADSPGLLLATGHGRNGVLLSGLTAAAVVGLIDDRPIDPVVRPCAPERFPTRAFSLAKEII